MLARLIDHGMQQAFGAGALLRRVDFRPLARLPNLPPLAWLGRHPLSAGA
jgi:hypothetical protein